MVAAVHSCYRPMSASFKKLVRQFQNIYKHFTTRLLSSFASQFAFRPLNTRYLSLQKRRRHCSWLLAKLRNGKSRTATLLSPTYPRYFRQRERNPRLFLKAKVIQASIQLNSDKSKILGFLENRSRIRNSAPRRHIHAKTSLTQ